MPPHGHEFPFFSLLLEGSYSEQAGGLIIHYAPFTTVFHAPGMVHSDTIGPTGARFFLVEIGASWVNLAERLGPLPAHIVELHGGEASWLIVRLYHAFIARDRESPLGIESLLLELCTFLNKVPIDESREPQWLRRVDSAIKTTFTQRIECSQIADEIGVHPGHLARAFRRFRGRTIGDAVTSLRMQLVCQRLAQSACSLADVALQAGYADESHLIRTFKSIMGITPGKYRSRMRYR